MLIGVSVVEETIPKTEKEITVTKSIQKLNLKEKKDHGRVARSRLSIKRVKFLS